MVYTGIPFTIFICISETLSNSNYTITHRERERERGDIYIYINAIDIVGLSLKW